jgi:holo-[acyl-carrier protein] synthase
LADSVIAGIGIDVAEVGRFEKEISLHGDELLRQFLSEDEIAACRMKGHPWRYFAAHFAAKEALSKALGTGVWGSMSWLDVQVRHDQSGKLELHLAGQAARRSEDLGIDSIHLSLCHEREYAAAVVVLERADVTPPPSRPSSDA